MLVSEMIMTDSVPLLCMKVIMIFQYKCLELYPFLYNYEWVKGSDFAYQCITNAIIELTFKGHSINTLFICLFMYSQIFTEHQLCTRH